MFHCALSQQRGPAAALMYMRARAEQATKTDRDMDLAKQTPQQVFVLEGGFVKWQEVYGLDERLTQAYAKDIWQDGGDY